MKSTIFIILSILVSSSCSSQKQESSTNKQVDEVILNSKESIKINKYQTWDSLVLVPLKEVYSNSTIELIKKDEYVLAGSKLVMGFVIKREKIYFGNSEKGGIYCLNLSNKVISKFVDIVTKDKTPITKIAVVNDLLFAADYNNTFQFDFNSLEKVSQMADAFGKNNINLIPVFDKYEIVALTNASLALKSKLIEYQLSPGYDQCISKNNQQQFLLLANQSGPISMLKIQQSKAIEVFNIEVLGQDLSKYEDVDIIYLDDENIKFVLKSGFPEDDPDMLVIYDLINSKVKNYLLLNTRLIESTFFGDPATFPSGSSYSYFEGYLWRMRNTQKGLCFENWKI